jgi:DNA-binding transcriptional ArsR family regulator
MQPQPRAWNAARARVVKALAHPTRLFVVDELAEHGQKCVCELRDLIGSDMSTVSRHLTILKNAGLVRDTRRGSQVFYQLRRDGVVRFLDCVDALMRQTAQDQQDELRAIR